jgi:hypothetical protein
MLGHVIIMAVWVALPSLQRALSGSRLVSRTNMRYIIRQLQIVKRDSLVFSPVLHDSRRQFSAKLGYF